MRNYFRKIIAALTLGFCLIGGSLSAQIVSPVKWSFDQKKISANEIELSFKAVIDRGWHLYGTDLPDGGPVSTSFKFIADDANFKFSGALTSQNKPIKQFDKIFKLELTYYALEANFTRRITLLNDRPFTIRGSVEYQSCNDETCTMDEVDFSFPINEKAASPVTPAKSAESVSPMVNEQAAPPAATCQ